MPNIKSLRNKMSSIRQVDHNINNGIRDLKQLVQNIRPMNIPTEFGPSRCGTEYVLRVETSRTASDVDGSTSLPPHRDSFLS